MMVCMCITIITDLAGSMSNTQSTHSLRHKSNTSGKRKGAYSNWNNIIILLMCYKNLIRPSERCKACGWVIACFVTFSLICH